MTISALIPIADGSEDIESTSIIDTLRRAEINVTVASVAPEGRKLVTLARGCRLEADAHIDDVKDTEFDLIALPGGLPGAEHLRDSAILVQMLKKQREAGRWYGAICASPAVSLHPHGLLPPTATVYPAPPFHELLLKDGIPQRKESIKLHVAVDEDWRCVTGMGPATAIEFALALVSAILSEEKAKAIGDAMLFGH